jgi:hypothetical protein
MPEHRALKFWRLLKMLDHIKIQHGQCKGLQMLCTPQPSLAFVELAQVALPAKLRSGFALHGHTCHAMPCHVIQFGSFHVLHAMFALPQVPAVWEESCVGKENSGQWWDAVDIVSIDVSRNQIQQLPEAISQLGASLLTLNIR